jgi:DNA-binding transcriptional MerR regulator
MDISELSKQTGIAPSKIRYYEEKGLIKSIGRNGLKRVFDSIVLEQLSFIALAQKSGFSLGEISAMVSQKGRFKVNRKQLLEKADEIDLQIKKLKSMRDGLRHASKCPAKNHYECPEFKKLLKRALG